MAHKLLNYFSFQRERVLFYFPYAAGIWSWLTYVQFFNKYPDWRPQKKISKTRDRFVWITYALYTHTHRPNLTTSQPPHHTPASACENIYGLTSNETHNSMMVLLLLLLVSLRMHCENVARVAYYKSSIRQGTTHHIKHTPPRRTTDALESRLKSQSQFWVTLTDSNGTHWAVSTTEAHDNGIRSGDG